MFPYRAFTEAFFKKRIKIRKKYVKEWDPKFVLDYMDRCLLLKGTPVFMKKVRGIPLPKGVVILTCRIYTPEEWKKKYFPTYWLYNVPPEVEAILAEYPKKVGDQWVKEWEAVYEYLRRIVKQK